MAMVGLIHLHEFCFELLQQTLGNGWISPVVGDVCQSQNRFWFGDVWGRMVRNKAVVIPARKGKKRMIGGIFEIQKVLWFLLTKHIMISPS